MAAKLEAQRAAEAVMAGPSLAPAPGAGTAGPPAELTVEEEADRERTREVREVMKVLTQLPQGLPTSLWGWDMAELARAIVDGDKQLTWEGTTLVSVKGRWYNSDRSNVGTFMREWKEPETAPPRAGPMTKDDRQRKLEQIETALLEGKISEQTYRELKRKYEG